ncbi:MAG: hypothetical protein NXI00_24690, partial [Cytophagales bacterium]|nr:hypothetical protein [Cytophagales bacterium]
MNHLLGSNERLYSFVRNSLFPEQEGYISTLIINKHYRITLQQEYQELLAQSESKEKYDKLTELMHSFVLAAEMYGKLIISERSIKKEGKVIGPTSMGGIAGGDKFVVQGILFK